MTVNFTALHRLFDPLIVVLCFWITQSLGPAYAQHAGEALNIWQYQASAQLDEPWLTIFRPPEPLANLLIHHLRPDGFQKVTGNADQDLLIVAPNRVIDGRVRLWVEGFRGIYLIGASFDPKPHGSLITPNGDERVGVGAVLKLQTHPHAVRPFVYLSRIDFQSSAISFGDWIQVGSTAGLDRPQGWPDIFRFMIRAEPLMGWRGYFGGTLSKHTSHSDFFKMEMGGVRHSYAAHIEAAMGYQHEFVAPSWRAGFQPYLGPDGRSEFHYFNYLATMSVDPVIGNPDPPVAFFLARNSTEIDDGAYNRFIFHEGSGQGLGVGIRATTQNGTIKRFVHPSGGRHAPAETVRGLDWLESPGFVRGRIKKIAPKGEFSVLDPRDVGHQHRIVDRAALIDLIEHWGSDRPYGAVEP